MPTDDERREAAARLRELADDYWHDGVRVMDEPETIDRLFRATGFDYRVPENWTVLEDGERDLTPAYMRHLADLIEPSCDRDALLELADEMDTVAASKETYMVPYWYLDNYVERIREALGVER